MITAYHRYMFWKNRQNITSVTVLVSNRMLRIYVRRFDHLFLDFHLSHTSIYSKAMTHINIWSKYTTMRSLALQAQT